MNDLGLIECVTISSLANKNEFVLSQLFTIFLNILTPVFGLVLIGYLLGPRLEIEARSVSRYAYYALTPAFLFNVFSSAKIEADLALRMVIFAVVGTLLMALIGYLLARIMRCSVEMTAAFILICVFGNVGNFGFPIIQFKYGEEALVDASLYFIVMSTLGFIVGVGVATISRGGKLGAILSVFKTPAIVAAIVALVANLFSIEVPLFVDRTAELLSGALIPTMLFALGIQLAGMSNISFDRNVWVVSITRLLIGPVIGILLAIPLSLSGVPRGTGILQLAMPAAVLASLIALEHDLMPNFVITSVLLTTIFSALTLTLVLYIV